MFLTANILFHGDVVTVRHVACCPGGPAARAIEYWEVNQIILLARGALVKAPLARLRGASRADAGAAFCGGPAVLRSHPAGAPDECLTP